MYPALTFLLNVRVTKETYFYSNQVQLSFFVVQILETYYYFTTIRGYVSRSSYTTLRSVYKKKTLGKKEKKTNKSNTKFKIKSEARHVSTLISFDLH